MVVELRAEAKEIETTGWIRHMANPHILWTDCMHF
jgi:hypothetical protein